MNKIKKSMIISFCGIDGSGKTTQANLLKKYLDCQYDCFVTSSFKPQYHSKILKNLIVNRGEEFHDHYTAEMRSLSYFCDMWDKYYNEIDQLYQEGTIIIYDKYVINSIVYAPILGCDYKLINSIFSLMPEANVNFYMDIDPKVALTKIIERDGDITNYKDHIDIMKKARKQFLEMALDNRNNLVLIENELPYEEKTRKIISIVQNILDEKEFWYEG